MAEELMPRDPNLPQLYWPGFKPNYWVSDYDDVPDWLYIEPLGKSQPGIECWVDHVFFRMDDASGEIVGIDIEDFEHFYLKNHPDVAAEWMRVKPLEKTSTERQKWTDAFVQRLVKLLPAEAHRSSVGT